MNIFENIINYKVSTITTEELLKYAKQFNITINRKAAEQLAQYLRDNKVNIFNDAERTKFIKEIAKKVGPETAKDVNRLFIQFTKSS
ncbi:DUF2624 domain-containing protein [Cytobacillus sp. Hz8]|uniref:DUF2624 domain-containing protein n=1 Tax=Cytobacillus sp. Hz8 TaxID=3347168 RepID=UPI0035E0ED9C